MLIPKKFPVGVTNRLLAALPRKVYQRLLPNLETITLPLKQVLYEPGKPIRYAYFPNQGILSLVTVMNDGALVEAALVGNEGMVGLSLVLGVDRTPGQVVVQAAGSSVRMTAARLKKEVKHGGPLLELLHRYTQTLLVQLAQNTACNGVHTIGQRCARWLLMTHDRMPSDQFLLTQEFLAVMLGVRRASVSEAASRLQRAGRISYHHGRITILDRHGLEGTACECYRVIKMELDRLLG